MSGHVFKSFIVTNVHFEGNIFVFRKILNTYNGYVDESKKQIGEERNAGRQN